MNSNVYNSYATSTGSVYIFLLYYIIYSYNCGHVDIITIQLHGDYSYHVWSISELRLRASGCDVHWVELYTFSKVYILKNQENACARRPVFQRVPAENALELPNRKVLIIMKHAIDTVAVL
jgi:hypothetical protein